MGFNKLDLLSNAPKNFIFQNHSNKTNFGGVLTLVLLIIALIIFVYYLICFITEENYSLQFIRYENFIVLKEAGIRMNDARYNLYIEFYFELIGADDYLMSDDYILLNESNDQIIPRGTALKKRVSDFLAFSILYKCNDTKNSNDIGECISPNEPLYLQREYIGFQLDHQNSTSPLHIMENKYLSSNDEILPHDFGILTEKWENIKYNKEAGFNKLWNNLKGINDEQQKYIGVRRIDSDFRSYRTVGEKEFGLVRYINGTKYRTLRIIKYELNLHHYDEYTRTRKNFLDLISKVFSLILGVFNFLTLFLTLLYSNSFDNYKIVE